MNLICFHTTVDLVKLSGGLSAGLLKITFTVKLCLTWDGLDRLRPNCISLTAAISCRLGVITDLASGYIFFGVVPVYHIWKGDGSV